MTQFAHDLIKVIPGKKGCFLWLLAIYILFGLSRPLTGQNIVNINAQLVDGNINIAYGITDADDYSLFDVDLYVSTDGGGSFDGPLKSVAGNVGENVFPESELVIVWDVMSEFNGLQSDNVVFEIQATENLCLNLDMIYVGGGSFKMGSRNGSVSEKPVHNVQLDGYHLGKFEITQKQWFALMGNNPSKNRNCPDCPVENISFEEVQEFIEKMNALGSAKFRLPTEAEWEYAATGGPNNIYSKFSGGNDMRGIGWFNGNSGNKTKPVGEKSPNRLGIHDLSGNVQEWCSDYYYANYYRTSNSKNPQGPNFGSSKVLRGGAFNQASTSCMLFRRQYEMPDVRSPNTGFRLVKISD